jgi:hypothetical protein
MLRRLIFVCHPGNTGFLGSICSGRGKIKNNFWEQVSPENHSMGSKRDIISKAVLQ